MDSIVFYTKYAFPTLKIGYKIAYIVIRVHALFKYFSKKHTDLPVDCTT